jgi:hypothetical protein
MIPWWGDLIIAVVSAGLFFALVILGLIAAAAIHEIKKDKRLKTAYRDAVKRDGRGPTIIHDNPGEEILRRVQGHYRRGHL